MVAGLDTRPSSIAGQWYPADPHHLASSVDAYIRAAELPALDGEVVAIMTPHAGHRYSGPVAGYAFAALRGLKPDLAAVVSPMHYLAASPLLTSAHAAYLTPLGPVMVDQAACQELNALLLKELNFGLDPVRRDPEHSLEIELPFLQRSLEGGFRLLPVMVRDASERVVRALGQALAQVLRSRKALLVASTDLSHFYPQTVAKGLDGELMRRVEAFDPLGVLRAEEEGVGFACGRAALAAVMWAAQALGANQVRLLNYATSGDVTGDYSQVVGYGAAVMLRSSKR
jgi:AmmeMemoRadiSam system protein B